MSNDPQSASGAGAGRRPAASSLTPSEGLYFQAACLRAPSFRSLSQVPTLSALGGGDPAAEGPEYRPLLPSLRFKQPLQPRGSV